MHKLYPLFLKVEDVSCLIIGGGTVATRKACSLLQSGARVAVVSPCFEDDLRALTRDFDKLSLKERCYEERDLDGVALVIAATDDADVNKSVFEAARARGQLVNVVDKPDLCNFFVPATMTRGDLQIAVSTGGACPALAKMIRRNLERQFDGRYEKILECLRIVRGELLDRYPDDLKRRSDSIRRIVYSDAIERAHELSKHDLLCEMRKWI